MWLCTRHGFFSVVQSREDDKKMMIRARDESHLLDLMSFCPHLDKDAPIMRTEHTDYEYRIILDDYLCVRVIQWMAHDIDYSNFKDAAQQHREEDRDYASFLYKVWSIGLDLIKAPQWNWPMSWHSMPEEEIEDASQIKSYD